MRQEDIKKAREELKKELVICMNRGMVGVNIKYKDTLQTALKALDLVSELVEVLKQAETAILDAMHAGNLSREYSNCVIPKIEQALSKYK